MIPHPLLIILYINSVNVFISFFRDPHHKAELFCLVNLLHNSNFLFSDEFEEFGSSLQR